MHRFVVRLVLIPAAMAAVAAAALVPASPAFADVIDTGGTATITEPFSYLAQLAKAGVVETVVAPATASADTTNQVVNVSFPVTGGNADASKLFGTLNLGGGIKLYTRKHTVTLTNVAYSIDTQTIDATPSGSTTPVALLDLGGSILNTISGTSQTVSSSQLTIDPAGAAYLDGALATSAFNAGDNAGTFTATWTVSGS